MTIRPFFLFCLLASACVQSQGKFAALSPSSDLELPAGPRVTGEDCSFFILGTHKEPSVRLATVHALEKAGPGYDTLLAADVRAKRYYFFLGSVCVEVEGTAVNSKTAK